jgi:hypothetical protein
MGRICLEKCDGDPGGVRTAWAWPAVARVTSRSAVPCIGRGTVKGSRSCHTHRRVVEIALFCVPGLSPTSQSRYSASANRRSARARASAATVALSRGGEDVSSESTSRRATAKISSTDRFHCASLACDGFGNPLNFLTNCNAAARTSSSVAGGAKLKSVLILRHMVPA